MADEKKEFKRTGGIKGLLDGAGLFYLGSCVVGLLTCVYLAQQETSQKLGLTPFLVGLGVGVAVQGIIFRTLFKAGAEVIRLLKRLNGLPYGGSLSATESEDDKSFHCSECGEQVANRDKYCTQCGATL